MSSLWIGLGTLALGAGTAYMGSQQQKKANEAALAQNATQNGDQNASAWNNYLMTRGISPTSRLSAGQMPTAGNFVATNTRLPLWAGFTTTKGDNGAKNTYALATPDMGGYIAGPTPDAVPAASTAPAKKGGVAGMSNTSKVVALVDPGMALISNKRGGSWYDPLKIF